MANLPRKRRPLARLVVLCLAIPAIFLTSNFGSHRLPKDRPQLIASRSDKGASAPSAHSVADSEIKSTAREVPRTSESIDELAARLTYATAWARETRPGFVEFKNWAERYAGTRDSEEKRMLISGGVLLAKSRRTLMAALIKSDPRAALDATVPAVIRAQLPAEIISLLESRVSGRGDFNVLGSSVAPGQPNLQPIVHEVTLNGTAYSASVYGRREYESTKQEVPLHGVALDGELALHESPVRVLEPGETVAATSQTQSVCPVSGLATVLPAAAPASNATDPTVIEVAGQPAVLCHIVHLQTLETTLTEAESGLGPHVLAAAGGGSAPSTGASSVLNLAWSTGVKRVLVILVDFSDFPGTPYDLDGGQSVTASYAQQIFDNSINPFYIEGSYNKTSLQTTVDPTVYRLPHLASDYSSDPNGAIHILNDVKTFGFTSEDTSSFDRLVIIFSNLAHVSGSQFSWSGTALIGASGALINGHCGLSTVAHELGHNYGLSHANLWQTPDGNPISAGGTTIEYGDIFDVMGSSYDVNGQFNPWHKSQLGWLSASAVTNVTTSGTYRIYRFDDAAANLNQTLAVEIARDGVRNYWIGLRKKVSQANSAISNQAYVIWGYSGIRQSDLLALGAPNDARSAGLPPGQTLNDSDYGITLQTIATGGTAPNEYIDVNITLSPSSAQPGTAIGQTAFQANWTTALALGATGYRLDVATDAAFTHFVPGFHDKAFTSETNTTVTGLLPSATYYYRIRTITSAGTSSNSVAVAVTTAAGTQTIPPAVPDPATARLINLSTRSFVGTGENIQIAGFIISGTAPKTVLIRAGGPSLSPYGVTGFLADPVLTLYSGQTVVATNDDWDATTIQPAQTALNTTTWTPGSKDAALLVTLAPGGYTAQVTGKNSSTGIALIEVYEYDRTQNTAKLINISTRSFVGTGDNIQIAGFIISGSAPKKVLIRAGGPSLAAFGISAPLADPVLTLYSGQTVMTSNDDWDATTIQPVVAAAGISPWTPGSKDAALVLTLAPGGYTAQVSGKANGTGVALIEVYEIQ